MIFRWYCVSGTFYTHSLLIKYKLFFFSFLIGGKNILKKYLQKFAFINYLLIFVV